ncbi:MAG TPA: acyl-CoA dehydrogenase N-terminal domain-containing protein, partial [Pyrinomonadaceae bacterium]|nr:acyl-CoA dehydrogenase N-terminal domain-containing protein [Pyrinomonadaceae bacterium]
MATYRAPLRDFRFLLHEFLQLQRYDNLPGFADASADVVDAVLQEGAKLMEEVMQPLNKVGDLEGCTLKHGVVATPKGFKEAYRQYCEGGWNGLTANP